MRGLSRTGATLAAALAVVVVVGGGSYALGAGQSSTITVCVRHHGGALYQARRCARHDRQLTWNRQGPQGPAGAQGATGATGAAGATGPAGPTTTVAPSGSTQTGVINIAGTATAGGQYVGAQAVSFPLRLTTAPTVVEVPWATTNPHCPGTPGAPAADPGYLCVYIRGDNDVHQVNAGQDLFPQEPGDLNYGAGTMGVLLTADSTSAGLVQVLGSWAVTAP